MTFSDYLRSCKIRNTPEGDFVSDARRPGSMPDVASLRELREFLEIRNACSEAIEAGENVWRQYLRARRRG